MSAFSGRSVRKMNGLGNNFVILDLRSDGAQVTPDIARRIADPEIGPGCDQVISLEHRGDDDLVFMGIWNADGSEVDACGNAARCVGSLLMDEAGIAEILFETGAGEISARRIGANRIAVDMGKPKFDWQEIPLSEETQDTRFVDIKLGPIDNPVLWGPSAVNVGNPHCVFFVDDAEAQEIERFGPMVENHPMFPERANVSVAQVTGEHSIRLRVWERGVGITRACGTAACAALVAANRRRLTARKATITLDGGDLAIEWDDHDRIIMTGPITDDGVVTLPESF